MLDCENGQMVIGPMGGTLLLFCLMPRILLNKDLFTSCRDQGLSVSPKRVGFGLCTYCHMPCLVFNKFQINFGTFKAVVLEALLSSLIQLHGILGTGSLVTKSVPNSLPIRKGQEMNPKD